MKKIILICLFFTFHAFLIRGQNVGYTQNVRGLVIDAGSKNPIEGVSVYLNSSPVLGAISNQTGEFEIKNVPIGTYDINISMTGYKPIKLINQQIKSGKEFIFEVELEEMVTTLNEVVVKAYSNKDKPLNEMASISARSFTVEETERYAGSLFDPARMASNYAGVMAANNCTSSLYSYINSI